MRNAAATFGLAPAFFLACALVLVAGAGPPEALQEAERARAALLQTQREAAARAHGAQNEARRLADARVAAAAKLREAEAATAAAADHVADLAGRMHEARLRLADRSADLGPLLPLIERLSRYPSETLLAVPLPPEQAVRGVLVMQGVARELEFEAAGLRREQAEVAGLQAQIEAELPHLSQALATQSAQATALDQQIRQTEGVRRAAEDAATEAARRAAVEAARADGLRAAIARIEADQAAAEARARDEAATATRQRRDADAAAAHQRQVALARPAGNGVGEAHGALVVPVAGTVVRNFGEPTDGGAATGLSYQAPPSARVVSPCDGRVMFAGPFRSYGLLVIVDCGRSTHFVLAGLDRLDAAVGQVVQAGEPVGVMPGWDPKAGGPRPSLYVELRRGGEPVNPAPFLRGKG